MVWRPPRVNPYAYGDDYQLRRPPARRPDDQEDMRRGMDYRESFLQQGSEDRSPTAECCDCELEDDVFYPSQTPPRSSGADRYHEPGSTPHYPRARTYNSQDGSEWSSISDSSSASSYYYTSSSDDETPERRAARRRTLPSWADTPSPIKDTTRKSPYLESFDIHYPPWDFESRYSVPDIPSRRMSRPQVPGSVSGQPRGRPTLSWSASPDGRPSVALNYPDAQKTPTHVHGLTADTYNKFLGKQDAALVMFYNSGQISSGSLQDWVKTNVVKAAQLTGGSNQTFASVDCAKEAGLCASQQVSTYPFFKLYSKGYLMKRISDFASPAKGK